MGWKSPSECQLRLFPTVWGDGSGGRVLRSHEGLSLDDWYLLKGRSTSGEMEIGGFMGLASLTQLVSYKLNKKPCSEK